MFVVTLHTICKARLCFVLMSKLIGNLLSTQFVLVWFDALADSRWKLYTEQNF